MDLKAQIQEDFDRVIGFFVKSSGLSDYAKFFVHALVSFFSKKRRIIMQGTSSTFFTLMQLFENKHCELKVVF
jgi:hypothetical protein